MKLSTVNIKKSGNGPSGYFYSASPNYPAGFVKILIFGSISILTIDLLYKTINGITYITREKCILFTTLPRWLFSVYENFIELFMVVIMHRFLKGNLKEVMV